MKFLAVSQDKSLLKSMCTEFEHQKYAVFSASSLKEAAEVCEKEKPEVIVADHIQTDGNFFDFYDSLKMAAKTEAPPVAILLVDQKSTLTPEVAIAMGAWALYTKPFNIKSLYYSVEDAVFSRRAGYTKRLDERVELISRLEIKLESASEYISTFSTNISFGGFFAALTSNIPELNEKVDFKLKFTNSDVIEGKGRVAWVRKTPKVGAQMGCGIQFSAGREKYVKVLVPIINEARTRQIETASFQIEDLKELLALSIQAAKEKISKKLSEIEYIPPAEKITIMCRLPQIHSAFTELMYELIYPMREIPNSKCTVEIKNLDEKNVQVIFTCIPSGTSLYIDQLIAEKVQPILDLHKASIESEFNSINSTVTITLPKN
ncbi:PilZ domain-containing protein [Fluviispira vulneris]|uniref:PilZ domain-containing protein n=1 Tax=Fluviispira vulneris TaxID=2763012 RepID=UPI001645067E|nr:PilZ domain-containing protein [Fluviispira vulneris]